MPFGGNDWLALTQEPTLEPDLPICDPHHHFWDFRTTRIPYQRYLLHELADDMRSGHNVRSTVFIEARAKRYTPTERTQMFHDTAVRIYRVPV
jgi:predicted TIM-barrel fold metal-dependent hydrolase